MSNITELEPKKVFNFFKEISDIPRGSGNEEVISNYLCEFAKSRNLEYYQDDAWNVIIKKSATKGYENAPVTIIQGHMDMVCEKTKESNHDFIKDPIELIVDGDLMYANNTTLGADDGIAIAFGLAILDSENIEHPAIEFIATSSEETNMGGANALKGDHLTGKMMLNIDGEDEGVLFVSCAGGVTMRTSFKPEMIEKEVDSLKITIKGLKGGHSGMEINQQRGNAIKILGRILYKAKLVGEVCLSEIEGGAKHNAIARDASAVLVGEKDVLNAVSKMIIEFTEALKVENIVMDSKLEIIVSDKEKVSKYFDLETSNNIIDYLQVTPYGVQTMSNDIKGLVQTSLNLGIIENNNGNVEVVTLIRSSNASEKEDTALKIEALAKLSKANIQREDEYPAWEYEHDSKIRDLAVKVWKETTGQEASVQAIHAGLECGLLKGILPNTDMISYGPELAEVHTPKEHMSISSVQKTWEFTKNMLKNIK